MSVIAVLLALLVIAVLIPKLNIDVRRFFITLLKIVGVIILIASLGVGAVYGYFSYQSKQEAQDRQLQKQKLQEKTFAAIEKGKASKDKREWRYLYNEEPLTGQKKATSAVLDSEDGLCEFQIDVHTNGRRNIWLSCDDLPAWSGNSSDETEVEVKFDGDALSATMKAKVSGKKVSDEYPSKHDMVLLDTCKPSDQQYPYICESSSKVFTKFLSVKKVAFRAEMKDRNDRYYWTVFTLNGIRQAFITIGAMAPQPEVKQDSPDTSTSNQSVPSTTEQNTHVVYPGERVGNFVLGMTKEQVIKIGKPHFRYNLSERMENWTYQNKRTGNMLSAMFADDKLVCVCFTNDKFDTVEGISTANFDQPHVELISNPPKTNDELIGQVSTTARLSLLRSRYNYRPGGLFYTVDSDGQRKGCIVAK